MDTDAYPRPALTADAVIFRGARDAREVLLVKRGREPYAGSWALPGGFVEPFERPEDTARRELAEETGFAFTGTLILAGVYGERGRDPRGWTVSAVYIGEVRGEAPDVLGGDDAAEARWWRTDGLPQLAFDHDRIIGEALTRSG